MQLILMGTGPFALPTFESLLESDHRVVAVVTRPVPPARGRRKGPENPVYRWACAVDAPLWQPTDVNDAETCLRIAKARADLLVVCDYGRILSAEVLRATRLGGINLHGSLLPKYRGAAPINWAIWNGETETGVTVIHMTPKLDAGPLLTTRRTAIDPDETAEQLEPRLARLGVEAVHEAIAMLEKWDGRSPLGTAQDPARSTRAPRLKKSDGLVDWSQSAERIRNQVRALKPWPGTYTVWNNGKRDIRLILDRVAVLPAEQPSGNETPGRVVRSGSQALWVAAGEGCLAVQRIQPAGKRVMDVGEFIRGYPVQPGDVLGAAGEGGLRR